MTIVRETEKGIIKWNISSYNYTCAVCGHYDDGFKGERQARSYARKHEHRHIGPYAAIMEAQTVGDLVRIAVEVTDGTNDALLCAAESYACRNRYYGDVAGERLPEWFDREAYARLLGVGGKGAVRT